MEQNNFPQDAALSAMLPQSDAATLGKLPQDAAPIELIEQNIILRTSAHVLTVRDVVRMFELEDIHVAERTIVNWCNKNKSGQVRLDAVFDENDRRYYITPASAELILADEKSKLRKGVSDLAALADTAAATLGKLPQDAAPNPPIAAPFRTVPQDAATSAASAGKPDIKDEVEKPYGSKLNDGAKNNEHISELEKEILDLKILNKGKDYFIEQMKSESVRLIDIIEQRNHAVGRLEERVQRLQLDAPNSSGHTRVHDMRGNDASAS